MENIFDLEELKNIIPNFPGYFVLKNDQSIIMSCSQQYAHITGFNSHKNLIGLTSADLRCPLADLAENFHIEDAFALQKGSFTVIDQYFLAHKVEKILLVQKQTLLDCKTQQKAILAHAIDISNTSHAIDIKSLIKLENKKNDNQLISWHLGDYDNFNLTKKEKECLFYVIQGKTAREISTIMCRSKRTIEMHINNIKQKFNVNSKALLFEKLLSYNLSKKIPSFLFLKNLNP